MSKLIALDDGHGMATAGKRTPYIPEIGRFIHENEFNRAVVGYLDQELRRCGFRTILVAPTDADTPLTTRTNIANNAGADAYVSVHYDAFDMVFDGDGKDPEGHTVFVHLGQTSKAAGQLAKCVLKYLDKGTPQKSRGIKEADFAVLRQTHMIAILTENGFMDNKREALLMIDPNFQKEVAREHAQGICEYFGVAYVPASTPVPTTGWVNTSAGWTYLENGTKKVNAWVKSNGVWYYMDGNGIMAKGWVKIKDLWYYLDAEGKMKTGWLNTGGKWYFLNPNGDMVTGLKQINGEFYHFDSSGAMAESKPVQLNADKDGHLK